MAIEAPPRPRQRLSAPPPSAPRRLGLVPVGRWLMAVGTLAAVAGAGLDAWRHLSDATLVHHEAVLSFSNPAHALLVAGIALGAFGVFLTLAGPTLERLPSRLRLGVPAAVAVAILATLVVAANSGLGHANTEHVTTASAAHDHATAPAAATPPAADSHDSHDFGTQPVDAATERLLQSQLAEARSAALRYPTVADALRGGYTLADPYYQGIGAHYMRYAEIDDVFDPARPEMLLYAGEDPTSPVVGIMYYVDRVNAPDGFAGPYDVWHRHFETCVGPHGTHFQGDPEAVECHHHGRTGWMLHAWVVPGWESVQGVFSMQNFRLH